MSSLFATSVLSRGEPCEDQQPIQSELDQVIASTGIERPELVSLVRYGCSVRTAHTGPATLEERISRSYTVAWPQYRKAGELWFYHSQACTYRDHAGPICGALGELAKWNGGKLFRFDQEIYPEELSELAMVLKEFFSPEVEIKSVRKGKWPTKQWRTGKRSYRVTIGQPPKLTGYEVVRDCKTIDRCSWKVSGGWEVFRVK